jgi:hypothetical protein
VFDTLDKKTMRLEYSNAESCLDYLTELILPPWKPRLIADAARTTKRVVVKDCGLPEPLHVPEAFLPR